MPSATAFAVEQAVGKAGLRLERVAEGVAEVEQRARAGGLALVLGDDPRLGATLWATAYSRSRGSPASIAAPLRVAPGEELGDRRSGRT